ncbi:hypothetical protein Acr_17g0010710 [Actinidia rufa]|uniref:Uncharacterized protein n=1 Tax=Actinidia rufa TaxID=165716 RepID=A0A7J0G403_9ERIC|nr:hypothetical protein Acr_17g0010710 [Actinidia rufa]
MSKSKGIPMQQQGKNIQNGRSQPLYSSNMTQGTQASLDEFKYGFPSDGLAIVSYKWWESSSLDNGEDTKGSGVEDTQGGKRKSEELSDALLMVGEKPVSRNDKSIMDLQGTGWLSDVRKSAADEGREALKLGVFRGCSVNKMDRRERKLLLRIFKSSLPSHWGYWSLEP